MFLCDKNTCTYLWDKLLELELPLKYRQIALLKVVPIQMPSDKFTIAYYNIPLLETSLVVQWLKSPRSQCRGLGLIPSQGTRSHMPQLRVHVLQLSVRVPQLKDPAHGNEDPACCN